MAIVHHRDSHPNLAWRPIPQPRQTGSQEGGCYTAGEVLRKGTRGNYGGRVSRTTQKTAHRAHTAHRTARRTSPFHRVGLLPGRPSVQKAVCPQCPHSGLSIGDLHSLPPQILGPYDHTTRRRPTGSGRHESPPPPTTTTTAPGTGMIFRQPTNRNNRFSAHIQFISLYTAGRGKAIRSDTHIIRGQPRRRAGGRGTHIDSIRLVAYMLVRGPGGGGGSSFQLSHSSTALGAGGGGVTMRYGAGVPVGAARGAHSVVACGGGGGPFGRWARGGAAAPPASQAAPADGTGGPATRCSVCPRSPRPSRSRWDGGLRHGLRWGGPGGRR